MDMAVLPCKTCTKNCYMIHGSKIKPEITNNKGAKFRNSFQFFKDMVAGFGERLQIPPAFIVKLRVNEMGIDENVVLQGPTTHKWNVKLYGSSKGLELVKGWDDFVLHHRIEWGDFLVFKYVSSSFFKVRIFGASAIEKNYLQPTCLATCYTRQEDKEVDEEIVSTEGRNFKPACGGRLFQSPKHRKQFMVKKGIENAQKKLEGIYYISCRRPVTQEERENALKAAYSFRSINPSYSIVMKGSHVYRNFWLNFSQKNGDHLLLPRERTKVTLVNTNNKEWHVQYLGNMNRPGLRGGWKHFSSENNLEEGDVCVFERVDNSEHKLRVHIFRVVEKYIPYKTVESSIKPKKEEDCMILETHQFHKEVNTNIATKKRKADANVVTEKGTVDANVATKKRISNKDVTAKKMGVNKNVATKKLKANIAVATNKTKLNRHVSTKKVKANANVVTNKTKFNKDVRIKKSRVNANISTKKLEGNADVATKKFRDKTDEDDATHLSAPEEEGKQVLQMQEKESGVSTSTASGSCKFKGCRRSRRFLKRENNWDRQISIEQSKNIICIEDDEDEMIIWDIKNPSLAMPMPLSSSSGPIIPYEKPIHVDIPQVENTVVPELKALSLVVALSPEEDTSQFHMNGYANWEA